MRKLFVISCVIATFVFCLNGFADAAKSKVKKKAKPQVKAKVLPKKALPQKVAAKPKNGDIIILAKSRSAFLNPNCEETRTCDLKSVFITVEQYKVFIEDSWTYGTSTVAGYETSGMESLEKYAFVNFIRGCMFDSEKSKSGEIQKNFGISILHFGGISRFCFPEWVIDSMDSDPAYNSDAELGRHYFYRWNSVPGSYDKKTEKLSGEKNPASPLLYIKDHPGGAFLSANGAINTSLEFKTCIFRASDIPNSAVPENINFAEPIYCADWQSSYIYNFDLGIFETKSEIDPFCKEKPQPY